MSQPQRVTFHRQSRLDGVELRYMHYLQRAWPCYSTGYDFIVPITWGGSVWYRGQDICLAPGQVLCAPPGQIYLMRQTQGGGSLATLTLDRELCRARATSSRLEVGMTTMPVTMSRRLADLFAALSTGLRDSAPLADSAAVVEAFVDQALLDAAAPDDEVPTPRSERILRRIHSGLSEEGETHVDLATLAELTGLSRFQVLRQFKRRYGLPPHSYQLFVRVGMAQQALRRGEAPARVAAATGFVDQSHLTRHFKRALGVTPAQYARAGIS